MRSASRTNWSEFAESSSLPAAISLKSATTSEDVQCDLIMIWSNFSKIPTICTPQFVCMSAFQQTVLDQFLEMITNKHSFRFLQNTSAHKELTSPLIKPLLLLLLLFSHSTFCISPCISICTSSNSDGMGCTVSVISCTCVLKPSPSSASSLAYRQTWQVF